MTSTPSDMGSPAIPVVVEEVASGTAGTARRARRVDPLDLVLGLTPGMRDAAAIYRQAVEHTAAGRGMGPMPWARDVAPRRGTGPRLWPQERAISAAGWYRIGDDAMGCVGAAGVVWWVVIDGLSLSGWDEQHARRKGTGREMLVRALAAMAEAYGCE